MPANEYYVSTLDQAKSWASNQSSSTGTPWVYNQLGDNRFVVKPQYQLPTSSGSQPATQPQYASVYPNPTYTPTNQGQVLGDSTIDLSNPVKQTEYANQQGFDTWEQYQNSLNQASSNQADILKEQQRLADEAYNESNNYLNQAENNLRSSLPDVMASAQSMYEASKGLLSGKNQATQNTLNENITQADQRKRNYLSQSGRLYNELNQGIRQRFGGASSAGLAASEINAREQQRRVGDIYNQFETTQREINLQKQASESEFQNGLMFLESQRQQRAMEIQQDFQSKLLEIQSNRSNLSTARSQLKIDLLNSYKAQLFALSQQDVSFKQQLYAQKQAFDQQLTTYEEQARQNLIRAASISPTTQTTTGTQTSLTLPGQTSAGKQVPYIGQISSRNKLEYPKYNQQFFA